MAAYRNPRSFSSARRPTHGTVSPIRCYPYTPASPRPSSLQPPPVSNLDLAVMHPHPYPQFPTSTPVTRSLPENPTSDLALPSLEHLANALHALAVADRSSRSRSRHPSDRRERLPSCERRSSHRRKHRVPSQSRDRRTTRDLGYQPEQTAVHVQAPVCQTFETTSPKTPARKLHYVPATPSSTAYSPQAPSLKQFSPPPVKEMLPTPPPSHAASSPRQSPSSPPKRHYEPAPPLLRTVSAPVPTIKVSAPSPTANPTALPRPRPSPQKAAMSRLTRFALAGREFDGDDAAIKALMTSFDHIVDSLVGREDEDEDEDRASELSID